jgi:competence protein ComEA
VAIGLALLAAVALVGGYGVAMRARPRAASVSLTSPSARTQQSAGKIYVHVGGAVKRPGLYRLARGSRVDDAIRAAGGVLEDANLDALNLAAKVKDGDKILVPTRNGEAEAQATGSGASDPSQGQLVNLNTATAADLDTLPGIGPALAQRIISYREQHGGFRKVEDLLDVPGIGPAKFDELRDLVAV